MVGSRTVLPFVLASILILQIPILSHPIYALPIGPGFDLFSTQPFTHDFGAPIGPVMLMGKPIGPGNTDTIVQRVGTHPVGSIPAGDVGDIDIELVALSLQSVSPVNVGGSFFDVFVTINKLGIPMLPQPDVLNPSMGMIMVTSHIDPNGGTFDSFFDVFFDVIFTDPGGNPNDPASVREHFAAGPLHLMNTGSTWSHTPFPNYPSDPRFPPDDFFPGPIPHQGMHPVVPAQVTPVGGEILPIDMTSLFIAGAFTNAFWILPMLGGIAGVMITIIRTRRKLK